MSQDPSQQPATPLWQCRLDDYEDPLAGGTFQLTRWTVGDRFLLKCEGPEAGPWKAKPQIRFADETLTYSLHILESPELESVKATFIVTGYKPGAYRPDFFEISDGQTTVRVQGLEWKVNSVLQPSQAQPPQPYGPIGPFALSWPWWLWAGFIGGILILAMFFQWRIRRRMDRKRLLERLAQKSTALTPYNQFNKELRLMMRRYHGRSDQDSQGLSSPYVTELDQSVRSYITRTLLVPALEWSTEEVMRDVRKRHRRLFKEHGGSLKKILDELDRAKQAKNVTLADCEQMHQIGHQVVDRLDAFQRGAKS